MCPTGTDVLPRAETQPDECSPWALTRISRGTPPSLRLRCPLPNPNAFLDSGLHTESAEHAGTQVVEEDLPMLALVIKEAPLAEQSPKHRAVTGFFRGPARSGRFELELTSKLLLAWSLLFPPALFRSLAHARAPLAVALRMRHQLPVFHRAARHCRYRVPFGDT